MITTSRTFEERERLAIEAASRERPELDFLLPFNTIRIERICHENYNKSIGLIIDELSNNHLEWYGYSLAERRDLSLIVDTLIQPGQFVTGIDVDFHPKEADKALEELYLRNQAEGREGTDDELVMVGIVHRHGFCTGVPIRSVHKDIKNLSDYLHWKFGETETLSPHPDDFDNIGRFKVETKDGSLLLLPNEIDGITLEYPFGSRREENAFLKSIGVSPASLKKTGGLRGLIRRHLESKGGFAATQNRYVSTATSIIYNQSGDQTYNEIALLAQGAVNNEYEHAFVVDLEVVDTGKGVARSLDQITAEVEKKVGWAKKYACVYSGKTSGKPVTVTTFGMQKAMGNLAGIWMKHWRSDRVDYISEAASDKLGYDFFHAACQYINDQPDAKYAVFLFGVLSEMEHGKDAVEASKSFDVFSCDPKNDSGEVPRPPFGALSADGVVRGIYSGESPKPEELCFYEAFVSASGSDERNMVLHEHIPILQGWEK